METGGIPFFIPHFCASNDLLMEEEKDKNQPAQGEAPVDTQPDAGTEQPVETPPAEGGGEEKDTPPAAPEEQPSGEETPAASEPSRLVGLAIKYTGETPESDEEAIDLLEMELEDMARYREDNTKVSQALMDALNSDPEMAAMLGDVMNGASLREAIARNMDIESLTPVEGERDYEAWGKAKQERLDRLKKMEEDDKRNAETVKRIAGNTDATKALIVQFAKDRKMSDEEARQMAVKLASFASDIMEMKVDEGTLDMIYKSMKMEDIIEDAKKEGAVAERNKKIEVARMKREETDGLPGLDKGKPGGEPKSKGGIADTFFTGVFEKRAKKQ